MTTHTYTDDGKVALDVNVVNQNGGGGPQEVEVSNFPDTQPVTGPLTNAQLAAIMGAASAALYTDATGAANGTAIALLKGIYVQLAIIAQNTAPGD